MGALLEQQTVEMTQIFCAEFISSQLSGSNFDKAFANGFLALQKPPNLPQVRTSIFISSSIIYDGEVLMLVEKGCLPIILIYLMEVEKSWLRVKKKYIF